MPYLMGLEQRIFYTKQGHGNPSTLLLVHGAGGTHLDWPPEIRRLAGASVYSIDLPGHGRSTGSGRNTVDDYAIDVLHFINTLGLEQVIIAGYSMGGAIAQKLALHKSPAVTGLILISTGARLRVAESVLNLISADYKEAIELLAGLSWSPDAPENLVTLAKERLFESGQDVTLLDFIACNSFDLMEEVTAIDLPTLVISGSADRLTPPKYGRFLSEGIPHSRFVEINGGGHMVFLEQPVIVTGAITNFLDDVCQVNS